MKHFSVKIVLVTMVLAITAVVFLLPHTPVQKKLSPEMNFLFGDFGSINKENLKSHVLPVRLTLAALVVEGRSHKWIASDSLDYLKVLERFGFFTPSKIKNWRSLEPEPHFSFSNPKNNIFSSCICVPSK